MKFYDAGHPIYEKNLRMMVETIVKSLDAPYAWSDMELKFIQQLKVKLEHNKLSVSPKQYNFIFNLWEKL